MKKILLFFVIGVMSLLLKAQTPINDNWFELGNASYSAELYSISFATANIGFAVGSGGACLKTTNAGNTWTAIDLGITYNLNKIVFINNQLGYMYGNNGNFDGKFLKTTDGGATWGSLFASTNKINNMSFLSESIGWLTAYDEFYKTTNGGINWATTPMTGYYDINEIVFLNQNTGFVVANNIAINLQRTTDGGVNWGLSNNNIIIDIDFPSENNGYALRSNNGFIYRTTNQGGSWSNAYGGINTSQEGIKFINNSNGFCWGRDNNSGKVFRTTNYGDDWGVVYNNPNADINGIEPSPSGNIFAVGKGGLILKSSDGLLWDTLHIGKVNGALNHIFFTDDNNGFAVGEKGTILKTTDAAANWTKINTNIVNDLKGLDFVNNTLGFISGNNNSIYKTTNAGDNWVLSNNGYMGGEGYQIDMIDEQNGYTSGIVYKTTNSGNNWGLTSNNSIAYSMQCINADTIITGSVSSIKYSYDGGSTWSSYSTNRSFFSLYFFNSKYGFIGDTWGRIYKTINAGQEFTQKYNCNLQINDLKFINDSVGYFVADNGYIGKTTDAGETWVSVESGTIRNLKSIFFTPDGTGYIVGNDGMVLRKVLASTYSLSFDIVDCFNNAVTGTDMTINGVTYPNGINNVTGLIEGNYQYIISKAGYLSDTAIVYLSSDSLIYIVLEADLDAPIALVASNINDYGFTANWADVIEADNFLLYVSDDNFISFLSGYNGLEITGTSYVINGIAPGTYCYYKLKSKNIFGLSDFSNIITANTTTSIEETVLHNLQVYPTPVSKELTISIDGNNELLDFEIINSIGQVVYKGNLKEKRTIQTLGLTKGIYMLKILADKDSILRKIVVQ